MNAVPGGSQPPPAVADGVVPFIPIAPQLSHLFASEWSARWYLAKHKSRLVDRGALLMHCGRWHVDLGRFDAAFREIAAHAARAQLAREAA